MSHSTMTPIRRRKALLIAASLLPAALLMEAALSPSLAQKAQFERNKPHVNIGTIGHASRSQTVQPSQYAPSEQSETGVLSKHHIGKLRKRSTLTTRRRPIPPRRHRTHP